MAALTGGVAARGGQSAKLVRLSFGFYDRHQTGQLMSRATVDLQAAKAAADAKAKAAAQACSRMLAGYLSANARMPHMLRWPTRP